MDRVYVANLPPDIRIKDIDDFFRPFGKLIYIDVNHRGNPVCANIQFDSPRNAFNAVKARHGYNYEGYTLQLRLVESEVRKRRDATPPPPPPSMFSNYERQNMNSGFSNNYNGNRMGQNYTANSSNFQLSSNNRGDLQQFPPNNRNSQQSMDFPSSNHSNMSRSTNMMQFSSSSCSNIDRQLPNTQFSNINRSNIPQQYSDFNRSNNQQQYSDFNRSSNQQQYSDFNRSNNQQQYSDNNVSRSNITRLNTFESRPDMMQQNMTPYPSNTNRPNIPQLQNLNIQHPNNNSWDSRNDGWNSSNFSSDNFGNNNNFNNNYDNAGTVTSYCPSNDQAVDDIFTSGLSGAGRKWYNRYIRKGFSPEMARKKALEHRKLPYLRGDRNKPIQNDPTNVALETIGNTLINLLSANSADNIQTGFSNNMGVGNNETTGPSSSVAPQTKGNPVSKQQYLKSLSALNAIKSKRIKSKKDVVSLKYHTQIVKDYRKFNSQNENGTAKITASKSIISRTGNPQKAPISSRTEKELSQLMIKQKAKLLKKARDMGEEAQNKRLGGAYKKRTKILMNHGFLEIEAKALAWHPLSALEELLSLKKEFDLLAKKTVFIPASKASLADTPKIVVYRNDLKYLEEYSKHRINGLSKTILYGLDKCLKRIHAYESSENLPLTDNKFTKLLKRITARESFANKKKSGAALVAAKKKAKQNKKPASEQKVKENVPNNSKESQENAKGFADAADLETNTKK